MKHVKLLILCSYLVTLGLNSGLLYAQGPNQYSSANHQKATEQKITALTAQQQLKRMQSGTLTSEQMVKAYLTRIEQLDRSGPELQSIISLNENAQSEAKALDKMRAQGNIKGPLHGLVVLVKDNVETSELPTTAGSLALMNNATQRDATIIRRLKNAGAIILGKTNLSEWANFRSTDSISGWSAIGGQTKNPHSLDRTPCGSSSGTGAAIAADFAALGIGTETNGSIICPASANGLVGVKPTVGLLSRTHIVPISHTQDTAGPMVKSVYDAALMLEVMAGSDANDSATRDADEKKKAYTQLLTNDIKGMRIGVMNAYKSSHPAIHEAFEKSLDALKAKGVELVYIEDSVEMPENFWDKSFDLLKIEFKQDLNKYLAKTPDTVVTRTLADIIEFNSNTPRQLALFGQEILDMSEETQGYNDEYKAIAKKLREATRDNGIDKLLKEHSVDALIAPSQTPAFMIDVLYSDSFSGGSAGIGWMAAIAGYPQVSLPMGEMRGLPINISVYASAWQEAKLLNIAYQLEQSIDALVKPTFARGSFEHPATKRHMKPYAADNSTD